MQSFLTHLITVYSGLCLAYVSISFVIYSIERSKKETQAQPESPVLEAQPEAPVEIPLASLKIYKLRGRSVVHTDTLPIELPQVIRRYILRGKEVIHLNDLEKTVYLTT